MQKLFKALVLLSLLSCNAAPSGEKQATSARPQKDSSAKAAAPSSSATPAFDTYCNARYGYCIDYPVAMMKPQPESGNGDGRIFNDRQDKETLRVWGRMNSDMDGHAVSLEQQFNEDLKAATADGRTVTYQKLGNTFFVISGYDKGKIFYQKTIVKDDAFAYALLRYEKGEKAVFDRISEKIFRSFH